MLDFLAGQDGRKLIAKARKLHSEGKSDKAAKTIESALKGGSEDFGLLLELGRIQFESGRRKEAASLFKRAHSLVPSRSQEILTLAEDLHYRMEKSVETGEVLLELYMERREFEEAERILESLGQAGFEELASRYRTIYENLSTRKSPREMSKRDLLIQYCLALISLRMGELEKTYSIFEAIEEADPGESANLVREARRICQTRYGEGYPHLALGSMLMRLGESEEAVKELRRAVELSRDLEKEVLQRLSWMVEGRATSFSLEAIADLSISQEELDKAMGYLERLLEVDGGRADVAIRKYREVLRLDSKNVRAHLSLGDLYLTKAQNDLAVSEFSQALEADPKVSDQIVTRYRRILEQEPGNTLAITYLADAYVKAGDLDGATSVLKMGYERNKSLAGDIVPRLEEVLGVNLEKVEAVSLLAEVYREKGETKRALQLYDHLSVLGSQGASMACEGLRRLLSSDPSIAEAKLLLATALAASGDFEHSVEQLGLVLKADGTAPVISKLDRLVRKRPEVAEGIVAIYEKLVLAGAERFITRFAIGEAYLVAGNLQRAVESFRECTKIDGSKYEEVVEAYERVLSRDEGFAPAHFALADIYLNKKELGKAIVELERVGELDEARSDEVLRKYFDLLKQDETNVEIRKAAVGLLLRKGMYQEAISLCERALEIVPIGETAHFHLKLGEAQLERGSLSKAVVPLTKSLDLNPSFAEEASLLLNKILAVDPSNIQARYSLARAYLSCEAFDKAVEEFSTIADTDPPKTKKVLEELQRIYILDPTSAVAHYARGRLLLKSEEVKEAVSEFERSLELGPQLLDRVILSLEQLLKTHDEEAQAHLILGKALIRKRLYDPAVLNLSRALAMYPGLKEPVIGALSKIREEDPRNTSSRLTLAEILTKDARFGQAVGLLKEVEEIDESERPKVVEMYVELVPLEPSNISLRYALADSYAKLGRLGQAVSQYEIVLSLAPDQLDEVIPKLGEVASTEDRSAILSLAKALVRKGEYEEAEEKVRELVKAHPDAVTEGMGVLVEILSAVPREVGASLLLGELQLLKGEPLKAANYLEKGLRWTQDDRQREELCLNLSRALYAAGEEERAWESFRNARELASDPGQFYEKLERMRGERLSFLVEKERGALARSPNDAGIKIRLASLLRRAGRPQEALEHLAFHSDDEKLMKLRAFELASCREAQGDLLAGIEVLRSFDAPPSLSSEDREILYKLALLYERMGDLGGAASALRRAILSSGEKGETRARLEELYRRIVVQGLRGGARVIEERSRIV